MASAVSDFDHEGRDVLTTDEAGHQTDAAVVGQVHRRHVGGVDQLVVHEHPAALSAGGGFGNLCLGHHSGAVASAVSDFDHEGRDVLATDEAGHQADSAVVGQVHRSHVGGVDQLVVHEDPAALSAGGLCGKFGL